MKILNLYAGIGGNRKLWGEEHLVTAVEKDPKIAEVYADLYPNDLVVVDDAHEFLRQHFSKYDFIWSSPPCQSHSSFRYNICVRYRGTEPRYPDMKLYEEILFLKYHDNVYSPVRKQGPKWVIENVKPYYDPLIKPDACLQRHLFWSNFPIPQKDFVGDNIRKAQIPDLQTRYGFDLSKYRIPNKRQVLRNCVSPELGHYILGLTSK